MQKKLCVLVFYVLFSATSSSGNCPDKDSLWRELVLLRDSSSLSPLQQLHELLPYEADVKSCPYRYDSTHAFLLQRIGVAYFKLGDYLKAVQYALQSIHIITTNAGRPSINVKYNIWNYYLLYVSYDALNKVSQKMEAYDSLATIQIRLKCVDRLGLSALYKRVEYCFDVGDYQQCLTYIKMGETVVREYSHGKDSAYYIFYFLGRKVGVQIIFRNYELAKELLVNKVEECKKAGAENYLGTIYTQLAEVEFIEQNYQKALLYYQQALAYAKQFKNDLNCKEILRFIGYNIYFKHFNDISGSFSYYKKALRYTSKDPSQKKSDSIETLNIYANIANLYVQQGLYDSAFTYFQRAFDQIKPGITEVDLLHSSLDEFAQQKNISYVSNLLIDKGDAYLKQFKETKQPFAFYKAIRVYKITDQLLERFRKEQSEFLSKLFWRNETRRLYEHAIDACYLQGSSMADAFYFFERSRAVLLNDQLNEQHWLGEEDISRQTQLNKKILALNRQLTGIDENAKQYGELQAELFNNIQERGRLEQVIKQKDPLYYQSFLDTTVINLQDAKKILLKDHQALLELFAGDSAEYSLLITSGYTYINKINKIDFDHTSNAYVSSISNPMKLNRGFDQFNIVASHLYKLIFQDIPLPVGRIIVSPDGPYFPFESLVITTSSTSPVYFLADHAVSYTYSARYLMNNFAANEPRNKGNFLGVAPVQYASTLSLAELQGSDLSLHEIGSYFSGVNNLVARQASKNNFLQEFSKYTIIQLYTHAADADTSSNHEPVIYFADSALYLSELATETKPVTRLVVLSACETGKGRLYQGEGVFSFNRGFASLGIPTSIINLWRVDNTTIYQITEIFYKYLSRGFPVDVALQKAKIDFMQQGSQVNKLPYYWAATIVSGKTEVLIESNNIWKYIGVMGMAMAGLSFFCWRKWRSHSN